MGDKSKLTPSLRLKIARRGLELRAERYARQEAEFLAQPIPPMPDCCDECRPKIEADRRNWMLYLLDCPTDSQRFAEED